MKKLSSVGIICIQVLFLTACPDPNTILGLIDLGLRIVQNFQKEANLQGQAPLIISSGISALNCVANVRERKLTKYEEGLLISECVVNVAGQTMPPDASDNVKKNWALVQALLKSINNIAVRQVAENSQVIGTLVVPPKENVVSDKELLKLKELEHEFVKVESVINKESKGD